MNTLALVRADDAVLEGRALLEDEHRTLLTAVALGAAHAETVAAAFAVEGAGDPLGAVEGNIAGGGGNVEGAGDDGEGAGEEGEDSENGGCVHVCGVGFEVVKLEVGSSLRKVNDS